MGENLSDIFWKSVIVIFHLIFFYYLRIHLFFPEFPNIILRPPKFENVGRYLVMIIS